MTVNVAVTIITITMAIAVLNQGENAYTRVRRLHRSATEIVTETVTVTVSLKESMSEHMTEITEVIMIAAAEHLKWKRIIVKSNT